MQSFRLYIIALVFGLCLVLQAADVQPPLIFNDSRVMSMGNAFTAVADDRNMLFYNPAGLANYGRKKTSLQQALINPTEWRPKYRNIGDLTLFSSEFGIYNNFSPEFIDSMYTLVNLGIIPADIAYLNDQVDSYNKIQKTKLAHFQTNAAHYGWGNLTYAQLTDLNEAMNVLSQGSVSSSLDLAILSYVNHYYGFGIFSSSDISMQFGTLGFIPDIKFKVRQDVMTIASVGIPWPTYKKLSVGLTFKHFHRLYINAQSIDDYLQAYMAFEKGQNLTDTLPTSGQYWSGMNFNTRLPDFVYLGTGNGFDVGFMYRYKHGINLGLQVSDVYTRIRWWDGKQSSFIPIDARAGISWRPDFSIWGLFEDPLVAFDIDDLFFRQNHNVFMKLHAGGEFKMLFKILQVRAGMNQGYFTYGAGLDLSLYFLSKIPVLKWLRPDSVYFPQFNPNRKDFLERNPCCCLFTSLFSELLYAHLKIDFLSYSRELGDYAGAVEDKQSSVRVSLSYSY